MIDKNSILSVYTEKQTLLEYLTAIEKALDNAVLVSADIVDEGSNKCHFVFTFEDDTKIITPTIEFIKPVKGASIRDGILYLTLADGTEVSAGSITASFGASTFNGDVLVKGNLQVNGYIEPKSWLIDKDLGLTLKSEAQAAGFSLYYQHERASNGKYNIVIAVVCNHPASDYQGYLIDPSDPSIRVTIPSEIGAKLYPTIGNLIDTKNINSNLISDTGSMDNYLPANQYCMASIRKASNTSLVIQLETKITANPTHNFVWRFEFNFTLS